MKIKLIMSTLAITFMLGFNTLAFANTTSDKGSTENSNQQKFKQSF